MEDVPEFVEQKAENNGRDNGGRFLPGNPGKPKGASKNKLRDDIRKFVTDKLESEFPTWFEELKNKEKIECLISLLPYVVSRLQSVAMSEDPEGPKATIDYTRLKPETLQEILNLTQHESHNS